MSELYDIRNFVQEFAEVTSLVLNLDIQVIDNELLRIVGTGISKARIGKYVRSNGIISRFILKGEERVMIKNPSNDKRCAECELYGRNICPDKAAVYAPIKIDGNIIGAIGIVGYTDEQAKYIFTHEKIMFDFIEAIAGLIDTKVLENRNIIKIKTYTKFLSTAISSINKGIIILDKHNNIIDINPYVLKKLNIDKENSISKHISDIFPTLNDHFLNKSYNDKNKHEIKCANKDFLLEIEQIDINDKAEGNIIILDDVRDTYNLAYQISQKQKEITFHNIFSEDHEFINFKNCIKEMAGFDSTILLMGETGVGKELFARSIHSSSKRKNAPFIVVNCGAIPDALIESELFGYEKGAFTGANASGKQGKFYMANKGTIFLDELENTPLYLQQKLLRVLEAHEIERVGGIKSIPIDVRIVAASNERLDEMVEKGEFREDLFHRLNVLSFLIPPLRRRGRDVLLLAEHYVERFNSKFNKNIMGISEEAKDIFLNYNWPGNIRELQNAIEYAVSISKDSYITPDNLPFQIKNAQQLRSFPKLEEVELQHIKRALDRFGWDEEGKIKAADQLGISRSTIYRRIKKMNELQDMYSIERC